jgi:hypothetical protein
MRSLLRERALKSELRECAAVTFAPPRCAVTTAPLDGSTNINEENSD